MATRSTSGCYAATPVLTLNHVEFLEDLYSSFDENRIEPVVYHHGPKLRYLELQLYLLLVLLVILVDFLFFAASLGSSSDLLSDSTSSKLVALILVMLIRGVLQVTRQVRR